MLRGNNRLAGAEINSVVAGVPPASRREAADTAASTVHLHFPRNKSPDFAQYKSEWLSQAQWLSVHAQTKPQKGNPYVQH